MYKLSVNNINMEFATEDERSEYVTNHWKEIEQFDVLVPCGFGGSWIDVRDLPFGV